MKDHHVGGYHNFALCLAAPLRRARKLVCSSYADIRTPSRYNVNQSCLAVCDHNAREYMRFIQLLIILSLSLCHHG